jgi:DNA-directed RNA polymerase subunit H (RpoH/RPB5)
MAPKLKSCDAGSASKHKRSHDVFSISEEVKILDMIEIEKNCMPRLPGCMARTNLPFVK